MVDVLLGFPHGSSVTDSIPWGVYHVVNRGPRRATFLLEDDYEAFLKTLAEAHVRMEGGSLCVLFNEVITIMFVLGPRRESVSSDADRKDCAENLSTTDLTTNSPRPFFSFANFSKSVLSHNFSIDR